MITEAFENQYNQAIGLVEERRFAEAEPILLLSLERFIESEGPLSEDVGWAAQNLAKMYEAKGDHARAIERWRQVIAVIEAHVGPEHISVGERLEIVGMLALDLERWQEAEAAFRRALTLFTAEYGPEHHLTVGVGFNLGNALFMRKQYPEAEALQQRLVDERIRSLGPHHPAVAQILVHLGSQRFQRKLYRPAFARYVQAVNIYESPECPLPDGYDAILTDYSRLARQVGDTEFAERILKRREQFLKQKLLALTLSAESSP